MNENHVKKKQKNPPDLDWTRWILINNSCRKPLIVWTQSCSAPDGNGREEHHGGDVVQEGGEDGGDEAEDDDHGPDSSSGQLVGLQGWTGQRDVSHRGISTNREQPWQWRHASLHQQTLCDVHIIVQKEKKNTWIWRICLLFGGALKIHELGWTPVFCSQESLTVREGQKTFFRIKARCCRAGTWSVGRRLDFEDEGLIVSSPLIQFLLLIENQPDETFSKSSDSISRVFGKCLGKGGKKLCGGAKHSWCSSSVLLWGFFF